MVRNPWIRCGYVEDLRAENHARSPLLGRLLTNEMLRLARPGDAVEGGGKAAMVGTAAEIEPTSALTYTLRFDDYFRRTPGAPIGGRPHHRHGERGNIHG